MEYNEFKQLVFDNLGEEFNVINLSDRQFLHITSKAFEKYNKFHNQATDTEMYLLTLTSGTFEYTLPDNTQEVLGYYKPANTSYPSLRKLMYEYNPEIVNMDLVSYAMFSAYIQEMDLITGIHFDFEFNPLTKVFRLKNLEDYSDIALEISTIITAEEAYEDVWFQSYTEALCMIRWAKNLMKLDRSLMGGVVINWREMLEEGQKMKEELEEQLKREEMDIVGIMMG